MSILPICITRTPVLHELAAPSGPSFRRWPFLVADTVDTMRAAQGQPRRPRRRLPVFVWRYAGGGAFDTTTVTSSNSTRDPRAAQRHRAESS